MTVRADHPLHDVVSPADGPVLVLHDPGTADLVADLANGDRFTLCPVGAPIPQAPRRWGAVALVARDALSLRRAASVLPPPGRTRLLAWWLAEADRPALLLPRPEWPPLLALHGRLLPDGGAVTTLRVDGPVAVRAVLGQVARDLTPGVAGQRGVVVATTSADPAAAPPADTGLVVAGTAAAAADPGRKVPPDVVVTDEADPDLPPHEVLGHAPAVVTSAAAPSPVDEALLNPRGFLRTPTAGEARLEAEPRELLRVHGDGLDLRLPDEVTPAVVGALRRHRAVRVAWGADPPPVLARAVAALAAAGVPLHGGPPPAVARTVLGTGLAEALDVVADLDDDLAREEHSVRLRRTALLEHSTLAWRERLAAEAGIRFRRLPRCTVLLSAGDPGRLAEVLQELAGQRGVDPDVVVVVRGPGITVPGTDQSVSVVDATHTPSAAAALAAGVDAAAGDVVVLLDDVTGHGPDVVGDLLLARHYSGARVVEMPPDTTRPDLATEQDVPDLSGGPVVLDRGHLRDVVGRLGRDADGAAVGAALARGRRVYRTHGLGVARRDTTTGARWLDRA